jgi:transcriptional regulator with XRE-family HTH domain
MAVKEAIRASGNSLPVVADLTGVDKGQLSRFMRDKRDVTLRTADRIVSGLGLELRLSRAKGR